MIRDAYSERFAVIVDEARITASPSQVDYYAVTKAEGNTTARKVGTSTENRTQDPLRNNANDMGMG